MIRIILGLMIALGLCQSALGAGARYFVSKSGNDNNSGTAWSSAWATISKVNSSISGGDTVFFATGRWRGQIIPVSGTAEERTLYACSSFVEGIAEIWGSDSVGGWTDTTVAGNTIYKAYFSQSGSRPWSYLCYTLGQIDATYDTLVTPVGSLSEVDRAGEFYWDPASQQLYVWIYGGGNPSNADMEASTRPAVHFTGEDYVTFWGFKMRYGGGGGGPVYLQGGSNHNHFEHLHLTRTAWPQGSNICIWGGTQSADGFSNDYNIVRACSLGGAWEVLGDGSAGSQGAHIKTYRFQHTLIEDCVFFRSGDGMPDDYYSCLHSKGYNCLYWTIRNNIFYGGVHSCLEVTSNIVSDSIYGNILIAHPSGTPYQLVIGPTDPVGGHGMYISNNTFYAGPGVIGEVNFITGDIGLDSLGEFKYNVIYSMDRDQMIMLRAGDANAYSIDHNIYYSGPSGDPYFFSDGTIRNSTEWQNTLGFDNNSMIGTNPEFYSVDSALIYTNPYSAFARPAAGTEMNLTYGGQTWTRYGAVQSTEPPPPDTTGPVFYSIRAVDLTSASATIAWSTNEAATSQVEYGTTVAYGNSTTADPSPVTNHNQAITNLSPQTLYHFRVRSTDVAGNESVSSDFTFTTPAPDYTPPVISNVAVTAVTAHSATVTWTTDEPASSQVEYGFDAGYGAATTVDPNPVTSHSVAVTGLIADTTYHFRVISTDVEGNQATGSDNTFATVTGAGSDNLALGIPANVSGTYPGYTVGAITDGIIDPRGGTGTTWASDDNSTSAHWVEIDFGADRTVGSVYIHWTWNGGWMTSRQYYIQRLTDSGYVDITLVDNSSQDSLTVTSFQPVTTSVIRIYQPADMGPATYSTIMWLTELEIYGGGGYQDTIPPDTIDDLGAAPGYNLGEIFLTWTAPSDVGAVGRASEYDLRWSLDSTGLTTDWQGCTSVQGAPEPGPAGYQEYFIMTDLDPGQLYYIAIKAQDESGNTSAISNIARDTARYELSLNTDSTRADLDGPSPQAILGTTRPWLSVRNINSDESNVYFFELAADSSFVDVVTSSPPVGQQEGATTRWQVQDGLHSGSVYFWRARANNYEYSDVWSFTIQPSTHAYPNPFRLFEVAEVTFTGIPPGTSLLLMTVSGATVRMWTDINDGEVTWDGTNESGRLVGSGTYLWYVEGTSIKDKLVVIR